LAVSYQWAESFADIDGISWDPLVPIDRSSLLGIDSRPTVERLAGLSGDSYEHVTWSDERGELPEEGSSPASQHERHFESDSDLAPRTIAKRVSEMLTLPGSRSDYHFGMLQAWEALYAARRRDGRVFDWIESLCLADIELMEQGPELVFAEDHWNNLDQGYPIFPAFQRLSSLYQREGYLADAVEIEKRCAALGAARPVGEEAIERQKALLEEDGR